MESPILVILTDLNSSTAGPQLGAVLLHHNNNQERCSKKHQQHHLPTRPTCHMTQAARTASKHKAHQWDAHLVCSS